jgi:chaperonin GroES
MKVKNQGVVVLPTEKKVTQVGEIIIPETASVAKRTKEGIVVAVGSGSKDNPMQVKPNDIIVYKKENYPKAENYDVIDQEDILYVK